MILVGFSYSLPKASSSFLFSFSFLFFLFIFVLFILLKRKIGSHTFFSLFLILLLFFTPSSSSYINTHFIEHQNPRFSVQAQDRTNLGAQKDLDNSIMNTVTWKDANDDVSGGATTRREGEVEEDAEDVVVVATSGKSLITKPTTSIPSSSSSWMKSKDPRIVRVSRAFGGKDRHSKVCTLRGLRDRRVRLSVPTAIQLYDLQERLGVDQPSKAVDWLLDAAKEEIDELPPLPISPESFSLFNHHQPFLNLGQRPGQDPTQLGFKINGCVEESTTSSREDNNKERGENDVVFTNNHHIGSYGTYHNMEHHQHSSFQADYHHQLHSLVPFPSQILVCPMITSTSTTTTTIQSLFPSSSSAGSGTMESIDPRQMVSHIQMPLMGNSSTSSSQNISTLYSLLHGTSNNNGGSNINNRISSVQFNRANTAAKANTSRFLGSESSTSRGSGHQM